MPFPGEPCGGESQFGLTSTNTRRQMSEFSSLLDLKCQRQCTALSHTRYPRDSRKCGRKGIHLLTHAARTCPTEVAGRRRFHDLKQALLRAMPQPECNLQNIRIEVFESLALEIVQRKCVARRRDLKRGDICGRMDSIGPQRSTRLSRRDKCAQFLPDTTGIGTRPLRVNPKTWGGMYVGTQLKRHKTLR